MIRKTFCLLAAMAGMLFADAVSYTYDAAGRLTGVTYPNGATIAYTYDAAGNLTARTVTGATVAAKKPDPKAKAAADKPRPDRSKSGTTDPKPGSRTTPDSLQTADSMP